MEKLHAAVARSTLSSQNLKNMRGSAKNGTPLWRQVHLQVKLYKTLARITFGGSHVAGV